MDAFAGLRLDNQAFDTTFVNYENLGKYPALQRRIDNIKNTQNYLETRQEAIKRLKAWGINDTYLTKPERDEYIKTLISEQNVQETIKQGDLSCRQWYDLGEKIKNQNTQLRQDADIANSIVARKVKQIAAERTAQELKEQRAIELQDAIIESKSIPSPFFAKENFDNFEELLNERDRIEKIQFAEGFKYGSEEFVRPEIIEHNKTEVSKGYEALNRAIGKKANYSDMDIEEVKELFEKLPINTDKLAKEMESNINNGQEKGFFENLFNTIKENKAVSAIIALAIITAGSIGIKNLIDICKSKKSQEQNKQ